MLHVPKNQGADYGQQRWNCLQAAAGGAQELAEGPPVCEYCHLFFSLPSSKLANQKSGECTEIECTDIAVNSGSSGVVSLKDACF